MNKNNKRVIVGLSGGVDSSVALYLLKKQGYQPIGVSLKFSVWTPPPKNLCLPRRSCKAKAGRENLCCTNESFKLAQKNCQKLGVPYYIIDCQQEFEKIVINYFIRELKAGRTPNPCVVCNQKLKFPKLFELAKKFGASHVSTGHYACITSNKQRTTNNEQVKKLAVESWQLRVAADAGKDQTYFLYTLKQKQLAKLIFPLANLIKDKVRKIANKEKIKYTQHESQDFCFVANQSLGKFLKTTIGQKPGPIYDTQKKLLGHHQGLYFYTIGQHKGLSLDKRYWVYKIDKKNNALLITDKEKELFKKELVIEKVNWISGKAPKLPIKIMAKIRYRQEMAPGIINYNQKSKVYRLKFRVGQKAITPGQSCVFYSPAEALAKVGNKKVCLGGGIIE